MTEDSHPTLADEKIYRALLEDVGELQSSACDVGIERRDTQSSIYVEERDKSVADKADDQTTGKVIQDTTRLARMAMILLARGLQVFASHISHKSKCFTSLSSAIAYLREQEEPYTVPLHLLLQWERNVGLIDLFTSDERLYCDKRVAQEMFDICLETFDWLRAFADSNK